MTHDLLAKGLAELGCEVFYYPRSGVAAPLPDGVQMVTELPSSVNVHHMLIDSDEHAFWQKNELLAPRIVSCHIDPRIIDRDWGEITDEWVFVSRSLARSLGKERFVWNGIDPTQYIYSETKQDYHLFMAPIDWAMKKGLDVAIDLARSIGFRLIVAGGSSNVDTIREIVNLCDPVPNVEYIGDVRGTFKAELLSGARSLIFPTKVNEAFGLVIAEALMSGTPVICSRNGACEELVSSDVGFVCDSIDDYRAALNNLDRIRPKDCREKALRDFHYISMSGKFIVEYEREIEEKGQRESGDLSS